MAGRNTGLTKAGCKIKKKLSFGLGPVVRRRRDLRPGIPFGGGRSGDRSFENDGGGRSGGGGGGDDDRNGFSGASCGGCQRSCSRRDRDGGVGEGRSGTGQRCRRKSGICAGRIYCRNGWARAPTLSGGGGHRAELGQLAQIVPLDEGGGPAWSGAPPRVEGGDHPA